MEGVRIAVGIVVVDAAFVALVVLIAWSRARSRLQDAADEAAHPRRHAGEKAPPRRGRAAVLVPVYRGTDDGRGA